MLYDHEAETFWQQAEGLGLVGAAAGLRLGRLPLPRTSWKQATAHYPQARVLSPETGYLRDYGRSPSPRTDQPSQTPRFFLGAPDRRLPAMERVVGLEFGDEAVAYGYGALHDRVIEDRRGGMNLVVAWTPGMASPLGEEDIRHGWDLGSSAVFQRPTLKGKPLSFVTNPDEPQTFRDTQTGSLWDIFGLAVSGQLKGHSLPRVEHTTGFWFAWAALRPNTTVVNH